MAIQFGSFMPVTRRPSLVFPSILDTSDSAFKFMQLHERSPLPLPQKLRLLSRPATLLGKRNPGRPLMIKEIVQQGGPPVKKSKVVVPGIAVAQNSPRVANLAAPPVSNEYSFPPAFNQPQNQAGSLDSHSKQRETQLEQQLLTMQQQNQSQSLQIQALMEQIANLTTQLQSLAAMQTSVPHEEDDSLMEGGGLQQESSDISLRRSCATMAHLSDAIKPSHPSAHIHHIPTPPVPGTWRVPLSPKHGINYLLSA